ncbi:hypothetical protein [Sorangium sp. So ce1097]|uniref:hypothetical protein n=1 Tax=Sorangium sp. So ce1097 TaxID=3133330 RepID=UPI003F60F17B
MAGSWITVGTRTLPVAKIRAPWPAGASKGSAAGRGRPGPTSASDGRSRRSAAIAGMPSCTSSDSPRAASSAIHTGRLGQPSSEYTTREGWISENSSASSARA